MRIVCVNLPWEKDGRLGVRAGSRWPFTTDAPLAYIPFPFFLSTAAAVLKKAGHDVLLVDAVASSLTFYEVLKKLEIFAPAMIVVETATPSFENDLRLAERIKQEHKEAAIVLCGPHATTFSRSILEKYAMIDYVLEGEYEITLGELVKALERCQKLSSVKGLVYRKGLKVQQNPRRPSLRCLDKLPWPEREALPMEKYHDGFCQMPFPSVQMLTSRGCPYGCTFCLWPQVMYGDRRFRCREAHDVVDEMEYLINRYHFKAVYFDDDCFNIEKRHVLAIAREIQRRGISIPWAAMARTERMDDEILDALADSHFYAVKYGIESVAPAVLKGIRKNMDLNKTRQIIQKTQARGIKVHLTFCLGLPGETGETLRALESFIDESKPDSAQFSFATPFPGTEYFRQIQKSGDLLSQNWSDYDGNAKCIVQTRFLGPQDLEVARKYLEARFSKS